MTVRNTAIQGFQELTGDHGGEDSLEAIYREYHPAVCRYLQLTGSSPADAAEIAQECFVRLITALSRGHGVEKPRPWLISVAHNLRLEMARKAERSAEATQHYVTEPVPDQEAVLLQNERMRRLHDAMQQLSERQRTYLHLRAEGLRLREIADLHGVTLQSVADACARAIQILGKLTHE